MKGIVALVAAALTALAMGACGGDDSGSSGVADVIRFETPPSGEIAFTTERMTAEAGQVAVEFNNPQPIRHRVVFENAEGDVIGKTDRIFDRATVRIIDLGPGEYKFFCSVDDHREKGMEGSLAVEG